MRLRRIAAAAVMFGLAIGCPADAMIPFGRGGTPGSIIGLPQACDPASSVCAGFQDGQTFVTWTDIATGAAGANYRYRVYRSTSPINSLNYTSATLIASYITNNSGQLFGGDPTSPTTQDDNPFVQSYRQDATRPMVVLENLGQPLAAYTGLQVYTAKAAESAYYAVVSTNTTNGSPAYIGATGPIAESVATPQAILWADSNARGQSFGKITGATNLPLVYKAHPSGANSGCNAVSCQWGDYWEMFLTTDEGWVDGRPVAFSVSEDAAQHAPSLAPRSLELIDRDTIWSTNASTGMELYHIGGGFTPNPLSGVANRFYLFGRKQIERELNWAIAHFNADPYAVHWKGQSMGAWGGASTGIHMTNPHLASMWLVYPVWRQDRRNCTNWPGKIWTDAMPFKASASSPATLGCTAASVLMSDGTTWGGDGGYADTPNFIASSAGSEIAPTFWTIGTGDIYPASFLEQIEADAAFDTAKVGHAFVWSTIQHESTAAGEGTINCDASFKDTTACYGKNLFKLNLPYIAFTNSSINDYLGTGGTRTNGMYDADYVGCHECGNKWTITSDTSGGFNFTVDNTWMDRSPTAYPTTTTTGTIAVSGSGTVSVTSSAGWLSTGTNPYALVGDDASPTTQEAIKITSTAGNVITFTSRGQFGTAAQSHASGVTIKQFPAQPTGPNGGPYTSMTTNLTPRRIQGFAKGTTNGQVISCSITPNGGSTTTQTPTVTNGLFTLTGVTINATGVTIVACS